MAKKAASKKIMTTSQWMLALSLLMNLKLNQVFETWVQLIFQKVVTLMYPQSEVMAMSPTEIENIQSLVVNIQYVLGTSVSLLLPTIAIILVLKVRKEPEHKLLAHLSILMSIVSVIVAFQTLFMYLTT